MKRILAVGLFVLAACASKSASETQSAAPSSQPAQMTQTTQTGEMKECSCGAAPTEACNPNCPPITWKSADCDSANGRPRACAEPAKH